MGDDSGRSDDSKAEGNDSEADQENTRQQTNVQVKIGDLGLAKRWCAGTPDMSSSNAGGLGTSTSESTLVNVNTDGTRSAGGRIKSEESHMFSETDAGTYLYMPREAFQSHHSVDSSYGYDPKKSDVFALGVLLFEMFYSFSTGKTNVQTHFGVASSFVIDSLCSALSITGMKKKKKGIC